MVERVEGSVYFLSVEGVMRFSREGLECISRGVVKGFRRLESGTTGFVQYLPDKRQVWFVFGSTGQSEIATTVGQSEIATTGQSEIATTGHSEIATTGTGHSESATTGHSESATTGHSESATTGHSESATTEGHSESATTGYVLVYDLRHGVFYEFDLSESTSPLPASDTRRLPLRRGSFLGKGYFKDVNVFYVRESFISSTRDPVALVYPCGTGDSESATTVVLSKLFLNKRKIKKIVTDSKFGKMVVRFYQRHGRRSVLEDVSHEEHEGYSKTTKCNGVVFGKSELKVDGFRREYFVEFDHSERGVYVFGHGFKGDFEILFEGVESLCWMDVWVR